MTLPASGSISLSQVNVELGLSSTAQISLNDAAVRALFGVASGAIDMQDGYGKANQFAFTISSNQTNANLATLATAAGWNGTSKVVATIDSGVYLSSNSTGTPGLTVSGSFPGGVELVNNGYIIGMGGAGGAGRSISFQTGSGGAAGSAGGLALSVSSAVSINNTGTIGGGGGGGGGGRATFYFASENVDNSNQGGGGGGGGRSGVTNSAGGAGGSASGLSKSRSGGGGGSGTSSSAGGGGAGGNYAGALGGSGGAGGGWGSAGSSGTNGNSTSYGGPFSGGAAGAAVSGNSNVTWVATGTRLGAIT